MKRTVLKLVVSALALSLAVVPLAACSGQSGQGGTSGSAEQAATVDLSGWKTMADAIANGGEPTASSWDENYYVSLFEIDDTVVRVVAKSGKDIDAKVADLSFGEEDYAEQLSKAIGDLELVSAEDITAEKVSQDELDALVGKTGQELFDDSWTFASYFMYGGEETGANIDKGNFSYGITFDTKVSEEVANSDETGEPLKEAKVVSAESVGASNAAVDPTLVEQK